MQHITQTLEGCNDLLPSVEDEVPEDNDASVMPPMLVCQDVAARPCLDGRVGLDVGAPMKWSAPCQVCPALATVAPPIVVPKTWRANVVSWLSTAAAHLEEAADPRRRSASTVSLLGLGRAGSNTGSLVALVLAVPLVALGAALCVAVAFIPGSREGSDEAGKQRPADAQRKPPMSRSASGSGSSSKVPTPPSLRAAAPDFGSRTSLGSANRPSFGGGSRHTGQPPSTPNLSSRQLSPLAHGLQSSQPRSRDQEPNGLCPKLTVPEGSECILGIPSIAGEKLGEVSLKNITDKFGQPLLFVGLTSAPGGGEFILLTKKDQQELAFCELTTGVDAEGWLGKIFRWDGELFARIREERATEMRGCDSGSETSSMQGSSGPTFVVCSEIGSPWELRVTGNLQDRRMTVENATQEVVAMVSPGEELALQRPQGARATVEDEFYKLRLAPHGDTCTIIVAFLAIERILSER